MRLVGGGEGCDFFLLVRWERGEGLVVGGGLVRLVGGGRGGVIVSLWVGGRGGCCEASGWGRERSEVVGGGRGM